MAGEFSIGTEWLFWLELFLAARKRIINTNIASKQTEFLLIECFNLALTLLGGHLTTKFIIWKIFQGSLWTYFSDLPMMIIETLISNQSFVISFSGIILRLSSILFVSVTFIVRKLKWKFYVPKIQYRIKVKYLILWA